MKRRIACVLWANTQGAAPSRRKELRQDTDPSSPSQGTGTDVAVRRHGLCVGEGRPRGRAGVAGERLAPRSRGELGVRKGERSMSLIWIVAIALCGGVAFGFLVAALMVVSKEQQEPRDWRSCRDCSHSAETRLFHG